LNSNPYRLATTNQSNQERRGRRWRGAQLLCRRSPHVYTLIRCDQQRSISAG